MADDHDSGPTPEKCKPKYKPYERFLEDTARDLGVTAEELRAAFKKLADEGRNG